MGLPRHLQVLVAESRQSGLALLEAPKVPAQLSELVLEPRRLLPARRVFPGFTPDRTS
jgi:hypothetical protein